MRPVAFVFVFAFLAAAPLRAQHDEGPVRFVRYEQGGHTSYGVLQGERIMEIDGDLFGAHRPTDRWVGLADVTLLPPTPAKKVIAVGLNYRSHLGDRAPSEYPGLFAKYPTSLVGQGEDILAPPDATNLHYEGEMVLVIGRTCADVSEDEAMDCVFGITAGNDVSERNWQRDDLQWLRAKGSDTFGPVGPTIARGVDPDDVLVETRVNGEVRQHERTSDLIFPTAAIVSYVSRYVTLEAGDLIFTGTPQTTQALELGDVVEVEVEGVGTLRNTVRRR
ncbi:MAG: fumarylacetoacetate hydrolase family protein [Gemmatimonadota bacterium]|jgi:2-keto-4-pentenoate hydratase/2-oxohepta-3-ene-1,7-dioic acid hydratase in catechol pathway